MPRRLSTSSYIVSTIHDIDKNCPTHTLWTSTTAHEWPEAVIASTRLGAKLYFGVVNLVIWIVYLRLVIAIKKKFRLPSPGVARATLNVSVLYVWVLSPMVFWVTVFTGFSAYGIALLPQLLPNTCASSKAFGFSYGWPCLREEIDSEINGEWHKNLMLCFGMALFLALILIFLFSVPDPPPVVCSRCRRSETPWNDEEKTGMVEQDLLA